MLIESKSLLDKLYGLRKCYYEQEKDKKMKFRETKVSAIEDVIRTLKSLETQTRENGKRIN